MTEALSLAGDYLLQHARNERSGRTDLTALNRDHYEAFDEAIRKEHQYNGWFTERYVRKALGAIAVMLDRKQLTTWAEGYPTLPVSQDKSRTVGVVMAGNIPLVGFHDMLSVITSGHRFLGKPSSKDDRLLKHIADVIIALEPGFSDRIRFTDGYLKEVDAIIATGSDNSARYFEYYFRNKPHIIRKNRNGIAILSGNEPEHELLKLGEDIFTYFGLGCRNVTKIYVPEDYDLTLFMKALEQFSEVSQHNKYNNNLDYNRSVYMMNGIPFLDNGILLLKEDPGLASPPGVVFYEKYSQLENVIEQIAAFRDKIQCVVTSISGIDHAIPPGTSQVPGLRDYADGIDTMEFLTGISNSDGI